MNELKLIRGGLMMEGSELRFVVFVLNESHLNELSWN